MADHRRFFIRPEQVDGDTVVLEGSAAHQICRVLRLSPGDRVSLLDGCGNEHQALIVAASHERVETRIQATEPARGEPGARLTLAVCLPKGDRMDQIAQKGTELGISEYVILDSARTVSRPGVAAMARKLERWGRIAAEAAEQCGRGRIPAFRGAVGIDELASTLGSYALTLVAWEEERDRPLKDVLRAHARVESVMIVIGPEGGLTTAEVRRLRDAGANCVSLGPRLLRSETAAIAACAVVMYELEGEL